MMRRMKLRKLILYLLLTILSGLGVFSLATGAPSVTVWLSFFAPLCYLVYLLIVDYPEIAFALFLTAGVYKADSRLSGIQQFVDLTVLFAILSLLGVFYGVFISKRIKVFVPPLRMLLPYVGLFVLSAISLIYTLSPLYGTDKFLRFSTITTIAFLLPLYLFQNQKSIDRFFLSFIGLGLAMFLDIVSGGLKPNDLGFETAFGSNYLAVGRICGNALIMAFFYFLPESKDAFHRFSYIAVSCALMFAIFVSGGRGPVIATFVSMIIVLIVMSTKIVIEASKNNMSVKKVDLSIIRSIGSFFILAIVVIFLFQDFFKTFLVRMQLLIEGLGTSSLNRLAKFAAALSAMTTFPVTIVGLGIGGFQMYYNGFDALRGDYPHNIFLEVGSELGLVGLMCLLLLVFYTFKTAFNELRKAHSSVSYLLAVTALALFLNMVFNSSISGDINDNRLLFTWIGTVFSIRYMIPRRGGPLV